MHKFSDLHIHQYTTFNNTCKFLHQVWSKFVKRIKMLKKESTLFLPIKVRRPLKMSSIKKIIFWHKRTYMKGVPHKTGLFRTCRKFIYAPWNVGNFTKIKLTQQKCWVVMVRPWGVWVHFPRAQNSKKGGCKFAPPKLGGKSPRLGWYPRECAFRHHVRESGVPT